MAEHLAPAMARLIAPRAQPPASDWFSKAWAAVLAGCPETDFAISFSGIGRRLGRDVLSLDADEARALCDAGMEIVPTDWGTDECARGALLLQFVASQQASRRHDFVRDLLQRGEVREQQAILRVLPYLPDPSDYLDLATWACRTHVQSVFDALACDNPFPRRYMPDPNFNQMVLKAIFIETGVGRIAGLDERMNDELVRMTLDYASERRAAGRPVPLDADRITSHARRPS